MTCKHLVPWFFAASAVVAGCGGGDGVSGSTTTPTTADVPNATDRAVSSSDRPVSGSDPAPSSADHPASSAEQPPGGGGAARPDPVCVRLCNRSAALGCALPSGAAVCAAACTTDIAEPCGPESAAFFECVLDRGYCAEDLDDEELTEDLIVGCASTWQAALECETAQ